MLPKLFLPTINLCGKSVNTWNVSVKSDTKYKIEHMRILAVDDKKAVLDLLTNLLDKSGHTVEIAQNGLAGFEKAQTGKFDLFIIDHLMPIMNGLQLTKNLSQCSTTSSTPVIFMTTQAIKNITSLEEASLMYQIIPKPINESILLMTIQQLAIPTPLQDAEFSKLITG